MCQWPSRFGARVDEKVTLRVILDLLLPGVEVSVEARDEKDSLFHFGIISDVKIQVNLIIVLPDVALVLLLVS